MHSSPGELLVLAAQGDASRGALARRVSRSPFCFADRGDRACDLSRLRAGLGRLHPFAIRRPSDLALRSGFADQRALSFVNLYMYGGGFDMHRDAGRKAPAVRPVRDAAARRRALFGLLGLFATWRLGRRIGGPFAGLMSLLLLAACPLYYGHMFINAKDGPFAAVMAIALLGIVRAFEEYPRADAVRPSRCAASASALPIGARVLGRLRRARCRFCRCS